MQIKNNKFLKRLLIQFLPALMLGYFLVFTVAYTWSLRSTLGQWNTLESSSTDTLTYSSEEWELIHLKSFLDARLAMSASDSIGLTINLKDSLIQLEMKGVVLRQVKFDRAEMSRFFKGLKPRPYAEHFSRPFSITEIEGTIEKNPVIVRKVPKDTLEAAQTKVEVDTSKVEFVEWHLLLDSALIVSVVQSDESETGPDWSTFRYRTRRHMENFRSSNYAVIRMKRPVIYPEITVFIPASEARSFFRALPPNGQVVLRL
ncbi:MAG: hypothetical protein ACOZDD_11700 [Bacteroidota bacterium]|mgnify:CR=1 FL=1